MESGLEQKYNFDVVRWQLLKDRKRTTFLGLNYARGRC
jgi:hypothetical protein